MEKLNIKFLIKKICQGKNNFKNTQDMRQDIFYF